MGADLDLDDVIAGHPRAQREVRLLRALVRASDEWAAGAQRFVAALNACTGREADDTAEADPTRAGGKDGLLDVADEFVRVVGFAVEPWDLNSVAPVLWTSRNNLLVAVAMRALARVGRMCIVSDDGDRNVTARFWPPPP